MQEYTPNTTPTILLVYCLINIPLFIYSFTYFSSSFFVLTGFLSVEKNHQLRKEGAKTPLQILELASEKVSKKTRQLFAICTTFGLLSLVMLNYLFYLLDYNLSIFSSLALNTLLFTAVFQVGLNRLRVLNDKHETTYAARTFKNTIESNKVISVVITVKQHAILYPITLAVTTISFLMTSACLAAILGFIFAISCAIMPIHTDPLNAFR